MKFRIHLLAALLNTLLVLPVLAVDYSVEPLKEAPPTDELSKEVAAQLSDTGIRVKRGSATYCDIWLGKKVVTISDFKPTTEVNYPFTPGQLIGVARFKRKGADFRDQDIGTGVYTLRYAHQPVDGAHVGTSLTRDFLLLIEGSKDTSPEVLEYKPLTKQSAEAAGSSHPALLSLQKPSGETADAPAIRHDEEKEWWIVSIPVAGASPKVTLELVVVGQAAE